MGTENMPNGQSRSPSETAWRAIAAAVEKIPVVGPAIKEGLLADRRSTLRFLAAAAFLLVIYPIILPLIAALLINWGILFNLHEFYAGTIRTAFRVKEATDTEIEEGGLYKRLDYYQVINIESNGRDAKRLDYPVEAWQRVTFQVQDVQLNSSTPSCAVPPSLQAVGTDLLTLGLGDQSVPFIQISNGTNTAEHPITETYWKQIQGAMENGKLTITFKPAADLKVAASSCDLKLTAKVTVKVFKDLVPHSATGP
jgi:hypothetical protein